MIDINNTEQGHVLPTMCQLQAPSDLSAGYVFEAMIDSIQVCHSTETVSSFVKEYSLA